MVGDEHVGGCARDPALVVEVLKARNTSAGERILQGSGVAEPTVRQLMRPGII